MKENPERVIRDMNYLHPILRDKADKAFTALQKVCPGIMAFETWRSPARQDFLYAKGRTTPGPKVTNAKAWESWHQFGLAFDVAVKAPTWSWKFDVNVVRAIMLDTFELEPGPKFENAHFQLTGGLTLAEATAIQRAGGTFAVWEQVTQILKQKSVA